MAQRQRFNVLTVPTTRGPAKPITQEVVVPSGERELRRGEVGKDLAEISRLEASGFVMSGSRNSRANAIKKINDDRAAEEERAKAERIANKSKKEDELMEHYRQLLLSKKSSHN